MKVNLKSLVLIGALLIPVASFAAEGDSIETKLSGSVVTKVKVTFAKDKAEAERAVKLANGVNSVTGVKDDIVVP